MGLDNGIMLKCSDEEYKKFPYYDETELGQEFKHIAYWRKCWSIRRDILHKLHGEDGGHTKIDPEDIPAIIKVLKPYLSKDYWEDSETIWEYEEYFDHLYELLVNLEYLKEWFKANPNTECYFYDSY